MTTLEERARELRERLDQFIDREGEWNMAFQADAEILETLTRVQAEARLEEAKWWAERVPSWTNETAGRMNELAGPQVRIP